MSEVSAEILTTPLEIITTASEMVTTASEMEQPNLVDSPLDKCQEPTAGELPTELKAVTEPIEPVVIPIIIKDIPSEITPDDLPPPLLFTMDKKPASEDDLVLKHPTKPYWNLERVVLVIFTAWFMLNLTPYCGCKA